MNNDCALTSPRHAAYMLFSGDRFDVDGITVNRTRGGGGIDAHVAEAVRVVKLTGLEGRIPGTATRGPAISS